MNGMTYKFFVRMGEVLPYPLSIEIYDEMAQDNMSAVDAKVINTYFEGAKMDQYAVWDLGDPAYVSGVLLAGSTDPIVDIAGVTQSEPIMLTNLMALAVEHLDFNSESDTMTIYFNACRS